MKNIFHILERNEKQNMKDAEIFVNNRWLEIEFNKLKKDDIFRVFSPEGDIFQNENGESVFTANSDSYIKVENEDGTKEWGIQIKDNILSYN